MQGGGALQLGVNVTARIAGEYGGDALRHSLLEASTHGFNAVTFVPSWFVSTPASSDLAPDPTFTASDTALRRGMEVAGELGLSVVLKPHVNLPGYYESRGNIDPSDRATWWERYDRMIGHYAALAQQAGATTLVIGTELERLTGDADAEQWRALAARLRAIYGGALTYATDAHDDPDRVTFWDELDYLGIDLYASLTDAEDTAPSVEQLVEAWNVPLGHLCALHTRWSRPVLLTEIGFRSTPRGLSDPADWAHVGDPDPAAQARAYEAAYRVLSEQSWLAGMHWWDWPSDLGAAAGDITGYCPHRKLAAHVATKWNRRLGSRTEQAREPGPAFVSVVVPVRNGERTIRDCVTALMALDYPSDRREVIVVDNASTDRTGSILASLPVTTVHEPVVGRSHARNRGIEESRGEIVAFIDADCMADRHWLRELVAAFEREPVSAVAGEILADQPTTTAQIFMSRKEPRWQSVVLQLPEPFAITANVAFRRDVLRYVGRFDPAFVTAEDVDLGWRFFAAGFQMSYCATATVSHRLRRTAWELFRQQEGLGYGRMLLCERYGIPRTNLPTRRQIRLAAGAVLRSASARSSKEQLAFASYELLLLVSLRVGALRRELIRSLPVSSAA